MRIEISPRYIPLSPYIYEVLNKGKDRFANDIWSKSHFNIFSYQYKINY